MKTLIILSFLLVANISFAQQRQVFLDFDSPNFNQDFIYRPPVREMERTLQRRQQEANRRQAAVSSNQHPTRQQRLDFDRADFNSDFVYRGPPALDLMAVIILAAVSPILLSSDFYISGGIGTRFSDDNSHFYPLRFGFRNGWHRHLDFEYGITLFDNFNFDNFNIDFNILYNFFDKRYGRRNAFRNGPLVNPFIGLVTSINSDLIALTAGLCVGVNITAGNIVNFSIRYSLLGYYDFRFHNNFAEKHSIEVGIFIKFQRAPFSLFRQIIN